MFEFFPVKALVSNFHLFLTEQLKGGIQALKWSQKEETEYLIQFQALKVPTNQCNGEAGDSFILIRKGREKTPFIPASKDGRETQTGWERGSTFADWLLGCHNSISQMVFDGEASGSAHLFYSSSWCWRDKSVGLSEVPSKGIKKSFRAEDNPSFCSLC